MDREPPNAVTEPDSTATATAESVDEASATGSACIRARGVGKRYTTRSGEVEALTDVDLTIQDQEFFCLLGPSGCGKSTFLRILSGLVSEYTGEIEISAARADGGSVTNMVFQEHGIFPWKTVLDNVAFGLKMDGVGKQQRYERARAYLEKVDLAEFADAYPHQLSGGMKQRVAIARAFTNDPEILLMDEPFGVLDAQTKRNLQTELLSLWSETKKTVVYVTHDIEEAITLGDRLAVMTARPGGVKAVLDIDLPRPRTRGAIPTDEFTTLRERVWELLSDEVQQSVER
ncbi:ABC transporter ATP-binding protein [Halonotius roseus]|uniref:ABC transporter ATP-binding protein n=1 Tax=Halonotius roseus TaxID=2511997 RepID=A0A544QRT8_9EURY|nr:ABC transporter ATP-binding protein [Halonotius roseus]TQQ82171.1 ABC transporter ATP-binding protein [Halonotius roseus]